MCKIGFAFKSKYDKYLKTRELLFHIDCEELSSSACDYTLYNIPNPPVDEADHVPRAANTQYTFVLVAYCGHIAITKAPLLALANIVLRLGLNN